MPEIHITEQPVEESVEGQIASLESEREELLAIAEHAEWLETQSETTQELARELAAKQTAGAMKPRFTLSTETRRGSTVYIAQSANGYHESRQSPEHALFLLVDSHRTRIEDTPAFHARILAKSGGDIKSARAVAMDLARSVRAANPNMPGAARDALVLAALQMREDAQDGKGPPPVTRAVQ
jgi:hypothetical protein